MGRHPITDWTIEQLVRVLDRPLKNNQIGTQKLIYAKEQGWGQMDYSNESYADLATLPGSDVAMDSFDFGNALWGVAMYCLTVPRVISRLGAHYNSIMSHRELDSKADQKAIKIGHKWAKKNKIDRLVWTNVENRRPKRK